MNFWEHTYKQNIGKMIGICFRYVNNRQLAEDLAHDAFLLAISKSSGFKGEGHFDAWLRRIVVNVALQYLREQKKETYREDWIKYNEEMKDEEEELARDFSEAELLEAINTLPEHHRLVFNLYVIDKYSHDQIAKELGISEGTSKSHLSRARKKIRRQLVHSQKKNRTPFAFLFLFNFLGIDHLYRKSFRDFYLNPVKPVPGNFFDRIQSSQAYTAATVTTGIGLNVILASVVLSTCMIGGWMLWKKPLKLNTSESTVSRQLSSDQSDSATSASPQLGQIKSHVNNIDSTSATLSKNPVNRNETNKLKNMKMLNTLGAVLIATSNFAAPTPPPIDVKPVGITQAFTMAQKNEPPKDKDSTRINGIISAAELFWSGQNKQVYLRGKKIKVNVGENNFNASGSVTFLDEVHCLVFDGKQIEPNGSIKLSADRYSVTILSPAHAAGKYGENGKKGAVEITPLL